MKNIIIGNRYFAVVRGFGSSVQEVIVDRPYENKKNAFHTKGVDLPGSQGFRADDLYDTKEEALAVVCAKNEKIKDIYRHQINNINELLNFMLNNTTNHCEEHSDNEAREVAIEKMKEFNFTVED